MTPSDIELTEEVKKVYAGTEAVRRINGIFEYGIMTCHNEISWWPMHIAPVPVHRYLVALLKTEK